MGARGYPRRRGTGGTRRTGTHRRWVAEAWERYDYSYSEAELREWIPKLRDLEARTSAVFAFFNNHARGQAPANAQQFRALLAAG